MKQIALAYGFAVLTALALTPPAFAQMSPAGDMKAPRLQPREPVDTPLPAAIPGAGGQNLQTSQSVAKQDSGDPTTELFTAINQGNYGAAQDAISRGANLNARDSLGETPIDLSVALNRNSITFMLLAARNDSGGAPIPMPAPNPQQVVAAPQYRTKAHAVPVKMVEQPKPVLAAPYAAHPGNAVGTPDVSAGFLGFDH